MLTHFNVAAFPCLAAIKVNLRWLVVIKVSSFAIDCQEQQATSRLLLTTCQVFSFHLHPSCLLPPALHFQTSIVIKHPRCPVPLTDTDAQIDTNIYWSDHRFPRINSGLVTGRSSLSWTITDGSDSFQSEGRKQGAKGRNERIIHGFIHTAWNTHNTMMWAGERVVLTQDFHDRQRSLDQLLTHSNSWCRIRQLHLRSTLVGVTSKI